MYYLILDTCIWINMAKDPWDPYLPKIKKLVENGKVTILLPSIVRDEWNRNRYEKVQKPALQNVESKVNMLKNLKQILPSSNELQSSMSILTSQLRGQAVEEFVLNGIRCVESIFQHDSTKHIMLTSHVQQLAIEQALRKEAPFRNKNSMADALLLFSFVDYTRKHKISPVYFITENSDDFSKSKKEKEELNDDLKKILEPDSIKYFVNIGKVIQLVSGNVQHEQPSLYVSRSLGELEKYIEDHRVRSIDVGERGECLVIYSDGNRENIQFKDYDFESCLNYFKHFVEDHELYGIGTMESMEIIINKSPPFTERSLFIRKKENYITLSECNFTGEINSQFNNRLQEIITTPSNTVVIGPKNGNVVRIVSAITSLFQSNWNIVTVEDRTELNVVYGRTHSILQPDNSIFKQFESISEALGLSSDRTLLNLGNYNSPNMSLQCILKYFHQKKGCIGIHGYISDLYKDMEKDLTLYLNSDLSSDEKSQYQDWVQSVDYVIKVGRKIGLDGAITEIWGRDSNNKLALLDKYD